ncbi:thymidylate synthase ThyX [Peptococcaceae bacterium CEB3]|nr:thymidylate synthase ThyX [Peptococcaceae bacterium CEB3]
MEVKLITTTPNYLRLIWLAARTCYSPLSPIGLLEQEAPVDEMLRLVDHLLKKRHLSVLEHCTMTFAVENVSRTLLAQYSRHRIGVSLSVQSQRYVSERHENQIFDFVLPDEIDRTDEAKRAFFRAMDQAQQAYNELLALGVKREDARFVLPGGAGTNFVTSLNLRSFLDVYQKRVLTPGAQWEIKEMLQRMAGLLLEREPWLAPYLRPEL